MDYFVYILYSSSMDRYYVGQTQHLEERLARHNSGRNKSTKGGIPWIMVHSGKFPDRASAVRQEQLIKNLGSRRYLKTIGENNAPGQSGSVS